MEPVYHWLGVLQLALTRRVVRRPHVDSVTPHLLALLDGQKLQASLPRVLVAARHHRQHLRAVWNRQIRHDGHIKLVPFLQADFVHADVGDHTLRIDGHRLLVAKLIVDNEPDGLRGDAQTPGHIGFIGADQHLQDVLLEAERVAGFLAFERRNQIVAMMAASAAVKDSLVTKEAGLAMDVEVPDDARFSEIEIHFQARRRFGLAAWALDGIWPWPTDFDAVRAR